MPDTKDIQNAYPQQTVQKLSLGFPIVRLVDLISLATGSCIEYALGPHQGKGSGETSLCTQLMGILTQDDMLLADR